MIRRSNACLLVLFLAMACGDSGESPDAGFDNTDAAARDVAFQDVPAPDAQGLDDAGGSDASDAAVDVSSSDSGTSRIEDALARLGDEASAASLDAEVEGGDGWPMTEAGRTLFVTRWNDASGAVSWVGTSNDFTAGVDVATQVGEFYYAVVEGAAGKYKWHAADAFRAPPEARRYGYDEFGEHGWVEAPASEHFERYRFPEHTVRARISAEAMTRVLVVHDGQNLFDPEAPFGGWGLDEALRAPAFENVLAIGVDNTPDRMSEYTHVADDPFGDGLLGGDADAYLALVFDSYLPRVVGAHGLSAAPMAMAGSSFGGLVSLYAALTREPVAVAAMSPTLGWGAFTADGTRCIQSLHMERRSVGIYIDSGGNGMCSDGDGDGIQEDSDDSDNFCVTSDYRDHLQGLGYEHGVDLVHWHEPGAPHNEAAWRARVPRMLEALTTLGW